MTAGEKERLLKLLTESHSAIHATIEGIDPEWRVHTDSSWRIKDILGHIATWDRQVTKSLRAYQAGSEYAITDFEEHAFNEQAVKAQQSLTAQQVYVEWEQARQDFIDVLKEIPSDLFPGDLLYPWGDESGSIAQLVEFMTDHDAEHRDEIMKALNEV
ncbi:DinB family protein [Chloroflexota bacterium]